MLSMPNKKSTSRTAKTNANKRTNNLRKIAKFQQQSARSVSKLQRDAIEATKNMIKEAFVSQKQIASSLNVPVSTQVSKQIVRQSNVMTNDFERATRSNNQLGVRVQDAFTDYNTSMLNAWASYWGAQPQQLIRG
jgi:ribosomal protein L16 Arg81 hydroxylase